MTTQPYIEIGSEKIIVEIGSITIIDTNTWSMSFQSSFYVSACHCGNPNILALFKRLMTTAYSFCSNQDINTLVVAFNLDHDDIVS